MFTPLSPERRRWLTFVVFYFFDTVFNGLGAPTGLRECRQVRLTRRYVLSALSRAFCKIFKTQPLRSIFLALPFVYFWTRFCLFNISAAPGAAGSPRVSLDSSS